MSDSEDEMIIPSKTRINDNELIDRLGNLPDCILLHIISLLNTKAAVKTCILSVRWKDLWKRLPTFIFHREYSTLVKFTEFVSNILTLRDCSLALQSIDFDNDVHDMCPDLVKRVVNYAISHHVQQLGLTVNCNIAQIPLTLFSSKTLTHLNLSIFNQNIDIENTPLNLPALTHLKLSVMNRDRIEVNTLFPTSCHLPLLTSLYLDNFAFCAGDNGRAKPFSAFKRLNSLILSTFTLRNTLSLCISSETLVNLNLCSYSNDYFEVELFTPSLFNFAFYGRPNHKVFGSGLSHVKHADIDALVFSLKDINPSLLLLSLLLEFENIKSMTLTASTLQFLSLNSNLLKTKFPSFSNLKSLRVKKKPLVTSFQWELIEAAKLRKSFKAGLELASPIPVGIVDFLVQNSSSAEVQIIDC